MIDKFRKLSDDKSSHMHESFGGVTPKTEGQQTVINRVTVPYKGPKDSANNNTNSNGGDESYSMGNSEIPKIFIGHVNRA